MKNWDTLSLILIPFLVFFNITTAGFLIAGPCHTDSDGAGQDGVDKVCGEYEEEEQD